ncbi:MAG: Oligoendopeptidase F, partial [uncultured Thermomicrobiales bacterium]
DRDRDPARRRVPVLRGAPRPRRPAPGGHLGPRGAVRHRRGVGGGVPGRRGASGGGRGLPRPARRGRGHAAGGVPHPGRGPDRGRDGRRLRRPPLQRGRRQPDLRRGGRPRDRPLRPLRGRRRLLRHRAAGHALRPPGRLLRRRAGPRGLPPRRRPGARPPGAHPLGRGRGVAGPLDRGHRHPRDGRDGARRQRPAPRGDRRRARRHRRPLPGQRRPLPPQPRRRRPPRRLGGRGRRPPRLRQHLRRRPRRWGQARRLLRPGAGLRLGAGSVARRRADPARRLPHPARYRLGEPADLAPLLPGPPPAARRDGAQAPPGRPDRAPDRRGAGRPLGGGGRAGTRWDRAARRGVRGDQPAGDRRPLGRRPAQPRQGGRRLLVGPLRRPPLHQHELARRPEQRQHPRPRAGPLAALLPRDARPAGGLLALRPLHRRGRLEHAPGAARRRPAGPRPGTRLGAGGARGADGEPPPLPLHDADPGPLRARLPHPGRAGRGAHRRGHGRDPGRALPPGLRRRGRGRRGAGGDHLGPLLAPVQPVLRLPVRDRDRRRGGARRPGPGRGGPRRRALPGLPERRRRRLPARPPPRRGGRPRLPPAGPGGLRRPRRLRRPAGGAGGRRI